MRVTYLGTTMLMFDDGIDQILFDCHVTRPSIPTCLFGKVATDRTVADRVIHQHAMDRLRAIIVSHSHHDHVMDAPYFACRCGADIYGSASTLNVARGGDVPEDQLHLFQPNQSFQIGAFRITVVPSIHSKAHWYNNDLGQTIDAPVVQPVAKKAYKEGGSFDFILEHNGKTVVIRPSYNYIEGQWTGQSADILFLGIAGLSKDTLENTQRFFQETVETLRPSLVIPLHWDNFFQPLYDEVRGMPKMFENTGESLHRLSEYCTDHRIDCIVQTPLTSIEL